MSAGLKDRALFECGTGHWVDKLDPCLIRESSGPVFCRLPMQIESVRELRKGRFRYGLHCLKGETIDQRLSKGLQQIFSTVQRQQLRRLSQAG